MVVDAVSPVGPIAITLIGRWVVCATVMCRNGSDAGDWKSGRPSPFMSMPTFATSPPRWVLMITPLPSRGVDVVTWIVGGGGGGVVPVLVVVVVVVVWTGSPFSRAIAMS